MRYTLKITIIVLVLITAIIVGCGIEDGTEECDLAELKIIENEKTCYSNNTLFVNLQNSGLKDLIGIKVYLESEYNVSITLEGEFAAGAPIRKRLGFGKQEMGEMKKVILRPIIGTESEKAVCKEQKLELELARCAG